MNVGFGVFEPGSMLLFFNNSIRLIGAFQERTATSLLGRKIVKLKRVTLTQSQVDLRTHQFRQYNLMSLKVYLVVGCKAIEVRKQGRATSTNIYNDKFIAGRSGNRIGSLIST